MADLSITASDVVVSNTASTQIVKLGEAVSAGEVLVYDSTDEDWILASNTTSALSGDGNDTYINIALADGAAGQRIASLKAGNSITLGSVLTAGRLYVLSASGAISPESDAASNDFTTYLGYAESTTSLYFSPISTGVQVA